jgi:hypothetical protein
VKTLAYYKKLKADAERAQVAYNRALFALQKETKQAGERMEQSGKAWRARPSAANRLKMLQAKKTWAERIKLLESLLGRLYTK